jgi:hypothetical protein
LTPEFKTRFLNQLSAQRHSCSSCSAAIEAMADFTTDRARREFVLSGMCQRCQDGVFKRATRSEAKDEDP